MPPPMVSAAQSVAAPVEPIRPLTVPVAAAAGHSYLQILKSSALIGGSSMVSIGVSVVRAKTMALLLGPSGVGLVGLYSAILDLTQSIAGMGIHQSGVRQIAEAVGAGDADRIARTAVVLRRVSLLLGVIGGVTLAAFSAQVSSWTFGTPDYAVSVSLLSIAVFCSSLTGGQAALIQGMRRIADLARIGVLAAFCGAAVSVLLVFLFREQGVVPSLVSVAAITLGISWWYRQKVEIPAVTVTTSQVADEATALLKLGFAFMASAVLTSGGAYAIRTMVGQSLGLEAAGLYQSAWGLGGLYVGFILQAMGSDFYPRLTAIANDHDECNRLVNEQAQISLLLAGPGVIATLTFAPLVIALFYARTFVGAVEPLRWICLGMVLRVVAWPMGFIVLAKGARTIFFWTEVAATCVHVGLAYVLVKPFGVTGATMAFCGLYLWHGVLVYWLVRRLTGFRWSVVNRRLGLIFLATIGAVFGGFFVLPLWGATTVGSLAALATGFYSLRAVCRLLSVDRIPSFLRPLLA